MELPIGALQVCMKMTADLVQHLNNCAAKTSDAGWRIIRRKSAGDVTAAISLAMVVSQLNRPQQTAQIFV